MALATKNSDVQTLNDLIIEKDGEIVGGAQSLSFSFSRDDQALHQAGGGALPFAIRQGNATISGSIEQLWLTQSVLSDVDLTTGKSPYLDIIGTSTNISPKKRVKIRDAVVNELSADLALNSETTVNKSFNALGIDR